MNMISCPFSWWIALKLETSTYLEISGVPRALCFFFFFIKYSAKKSCLTESKDSNPYHMDLSAQTPTPWNLVKSSGWLVNVISGFPDINGLALLNFFQISGLKLVDVRYTLQRCDCGVGYVGTDIGVQEGLESEGVGGWWDCYMEFCGELMCRKWQGMWGRLQEQSWTLWLDLAPELEG